MSVESLIRKVIDSKGYITIDEMMTISMSDSESSYYRSMQPLGINGDFLTSPEISQMFGEMIGVWAISAWEKLDRPTSFNLVEFGPGRGLLMRDLLRATSSIKDFHDAINIYFCEINSLLMKEQKKNLEPFNAQISYISAVEDINNNFPSIIIANEFFDALPIKQYIKSQDSWREIVLKLDASGDFSWGNIKSDENFANHINTKDGAILEKSDISQDIASGMSKYIHQNKGCALIIDYGYDVESSLRQEDQYHSTLQAVKNHQFYDILEDLGSADLSSHVDFAALRHIFESADNTNVSLMSQKELLMSLGIEVRLDRLIQNNPDLRRVLKNQYYRLTSEDQMGFLFKALIVECY